jgi:hypothetical protein
MEISKNLNTKNLSSTVVKSIIYNTIIEVFIKEKKIDIKQYLISINEVWNVFLVKTTKPIINNELYLVNEKIKQESLSKLKKMWFNFTNFDIRYK